MNRHQGIAAKLIFDLVLLVFGDVLIVFSKVHHDWLFDLLTFAKKLINAATVVRH